jgi:hypothetical protein
VCGSYRIHVDDAADLIDCLNDIHSDAAAGDVRHLRAVDMPAAKMKRWIFALTSCRLASVARLQ